MKKLYIFLVVAFIGCIGNAQIVNIPDANFRAKLLSASPYNTFASTQTPDANGNVSINTKIDTNNDGQIQVSEALAIKFLRIYDSSSGLQPIYNLNGLENFTNLESLLVQGYEYLISINVSTLTNLRYFNCINNTLFDLNVSNLVNLRTLYCGQNNFQNLDLSNLAHLEKFGCHNGFLRSLNIKNGNTETELLFSGNSNLKYICADEQDLALVQSLINSYGLTLTCQANSYCTFSPGGTFYTINGNNIFDVNNNNCDENDIFYPNLKFNISNGNQSLTYICNTSGNYDIPVISGTYSMTPQLENINYYTISPNSTIINFPDDINPYTQNFCITTQGIHNDIEVNILPLDAARPGFNAYYKIVYKNKGNQVANGTFTFNFDDTLMDLVSSIPAADGSVTNNLTWNFTNLNPFETREIDLILNINSPTETPAVTGGDILVFTGTIVGATDETPNDNTFTLNQTVVNSYDPNDKTCLEGTSISPSMVGDYVHYLIRFENTGTYPAENIVVKDDIDITKFDIATLVPLSSSHNFTTRITNTNKVEFIFENINLPFDDANNDGYVAFKIKTKPTLVVGNTFSNRANIYFDYNFPIITNNFTTTVQALGNQDFEFNTVFSLSPVPTKDVLTITAKENVVMTSASIYNTLGQLVQVHTNPNETIDVSELQSGSYFIKIVSDKGSTTGKFIKE